MELGPPRAQTDLVSRVHYCILADELNQHQLRQLIEAGNVVESSAQILERLLMRDRAQCYERIPFTRVVVLRLEEGKDEFGRIGDQVLGVLEYRRHSEHSIFPDVGVAVLETLAGGGEQGL
jgi:hypothetical protein